MNKGAEDAISCLGTFAIQVFATGACATFDGDVGDRGAGEFLTRGRSRPLFAPSDLTPEQIRALENSPPPAASGAHYPSSSGRPGTTLLVTGGIFTGLGVVFLAAGAGTLFAPTNCSGDLCGLGQGIAGASLMGVGGLHLAIGIPMLAVGGYRRSQVN